MPATTYEGHVENGRIVLDKDVKLPEQAAVYVLVPHRVEQPKERQPSTPPTIELPPIHGQVIRLGPRIVREPGAPPLRVRIYRTSDGQSL